MSTRATIAGVVGALVLTGGALPAFGQDAGFTAPAPVHYDWTGPYAGATVGGVWGAFDTVYGTPPRGPFGLDGSAFSLGALAGVAAQFNNVVFGVEVDVGFADLDESRILAGVPVSVGSDWSSTLRGRAGYAFDRYMIYGTAGLAIGDVDVSAPGGSFSRTRLGWTIGAGVETAITDNFTARAEYLYTDLGQARGTIGGSPFTSEFDSHTIRAGVTYRFR